MRQDYPILEFDPTREAIIEPGRLIRRIDVPEHCVICFFRDVLDGLVETGRATHIVDSRSEMGRHPLYEIDVEGQRLAFFHPGVGAPMAAAMLEETIARGCRTFIACGGAGVLNSDIAVGHIVVPNAAVRDEGVSYHYAPPSREVYPAPEAIAAIERVLERHKLPYIVGKTWTTDAFYRETPGKVSLRRAEGCLTVEMEAASFFAVAQFRGVTFGQLLYGGDDLGGEAWDHRDWVNHSSVREKLFWLAAEACLEIEV